MDFSGAGVQDGIYCQEIELGYKVEATKVYLKGDLKGGCGCKFCQQAGRHEDDHVPRGNEGVPVNQVAVSEAERVLCIGVWLELVTDQEEG